MIGRDSCPMSGPKAQGRHVAEEKGGAAQRRRRGGKRRSANKRDRLIVDWRKVRGARRGWTAESPSTSGQTVPFGDRPKNKRERQTKRGNPLWARIPPDPVLPSNSPPAATPPLTPQAIEERLAGVPVYALSNSRDEFVLVSGVSTGKSLGLMCFKKEDADALLHQMKSMDPEMRKDGSKVVAVALNKVFQLKVDGVSLRLIPESAQVKNALTERKKVGLSDEGFPGVPVFQSRSLVLSSQTKNYRPVFFRKEDLEKSLVRASRDQKKLNPLFRDGDIQVAVFEEVIKSMKENSGSTWNDVVFIPPGFDVSTDPTAQEQE
ncbi:unnamed protein product [Linum tenue]|uniref:Protein TIC 22-like, chloroplastic n=1 Tax=Linum tenue TaxID=586396 RepID=A0AAV0N3Q9_9ROSI|nr:unnamed protein product [Linum tenue]